MVKHGEKLGKTELRHGITRQHVDSDGCRDVFVSLNENTATNVILVKGSDKFEVSIIGQHGIDVLPLDRNAELKPVTVNAQIINDSAVIDLLVGDYREVYTMFNGI